MGMGHFATYADTVTDAFVKETCPNEYEALIQTLADNEYDIEKLAQCSNFGGDIDGELRVDLEDVPANLIMNAYDSLCMAFQEKTRTNWAYAVINGQEQQLPRGSLKAKSCR